MWSMNRWEKHVVYMANQPNTLQKKANSWLVNVDNPIDTKRLFWNSSTHLRLAWDIVNHVLGHVKKTYGTSGGT